MAELVELLTLTDLTRLLRMHRVTLLCGLRSGAIKIPIIQLGRGCKLRFDPADVTAWIATVKQQSRGENGRAPAQQEESP